MNAERLLAHYEKIVDAPDAIPQLCRFVLSLAISGKLMHADEANWKQSPITDCLEPLADGRLIHQGWSPRCENHSSANEQIWGVLKTTAIQDGQFLPEQNKELPLKLEPKPHLEVQRGDILITCAGPRARCGIACLVTETRRRLMISGKMYRFRAKTGVILPQYLLLFLRSDDARASIDAMKTGSSESGLNLTQDRFSKLQVRVGPLTEQQSTVTKVDELMALCNRLEAARAEREATRDKLAAASLARLNTPDLDTFRDDGRFALDALPEFTARADQIKRLRQTILNLAVCGKLVPQDLADQPVSELLNWISAERGSSRRSTVTTNSRLEPVAIPQSWKWVALGELVVAGPQNGISPKLSKRDNAPMAITLTATTSGVFDPTQFKRVEIEISEGSDLWLREGDLLFQRGNTREYVGIAAIYNGPPRTFLFPDLIMRVRVSSLLDIRFVHLAAISSPARAYFAARASGASATMPKINQTTLVSLPIPLPPVPEQHRIVAKFDELMVLCDRLEASLAASCEIRRRLLEALLAEAHAPDEGSRLKAAE